MKKLLTAILLISLTLNCSKSEIQQANEIYKRTSYQNKLNNTSSGIENAIDILVNFLEKEPDNLDAKILLWKCYIKSENPKSEILRSELIAEKQSIVSKIKTHMGDNDEIVRQHIVTLLGELDSPAAVPILLDVLEKDLFKNVQQAAAESLAKLKDKRAIPVLLEKLDSQNPLVRYYAVATLGSFNDDVIIRRLLEVLSNAEETSDVRHQAALSLASIHNKTAETQLLSIFNSTDQPADTKLLAALTLGVLNNPIGLEFALESAKTENVYIVGLSLEALGYIRDSKALPILIENLKYGNKALRSIAAEALGNLGDPKAIPALKQGLTDPISSVRESAQFAISKLEK